MRRRRFPHIVTPGEFAEHRKALGLSKAKCAIYFRLGAEGRRTIALWEAGNNARGIPGHAQELMLAYMGGHRPFGVTFPCDKKEES